MYINKTVGKVITKTVLENAGALANFSKLKSNINSTVRLQKSFWKT